MVDIIDGELRFNELNKDSRGGTEMVAVELSKRIRPDLLKGVQIINSRTRELVPDHKHILLCHDLAGDPEVQHLRDPEKRAQYDLIVFVSYWQFQQYHGHLGVPYGKSMVINNGIVPFEFHNKPDPNEQINLIYHTTPHRGLELLMPVFDALCKEFSNLHLDVYSSFKIYGWEQRDKPYEELFERIKNHPNCTYHGYKPNDEVRDALRNAHIFAFPSIWQETSCISLMEAMSANCICVHPDYAALIETSGNMTDIYRWDEDPNQHMMAFYRFIKNAIMQVQSDSKLFDEPSCAKLFIDSNNSWEYIIEQWEHVLRNMKDE